MVGPERVLKSPGPFIVQNLFYPLCYRVKDPFFQERIAPLIDRRGVLARQSRVSAGAF
jgi:hypothetical protein